MRERLASLSDEARSIRSQVPSEFEPDVERIQQQMQRLGERLSDLGGGAFALSGGKGSADTETNTEVSPAQPNEVIALGESAKADNPWDEESANALTRFYESGEAFLDSDPGDASAKEQQPAMPASEPTRALQTAYPSEYGPAGAGSEAPQASERESMGAGSGWLDQRFAEIAQRIEQSLAEIRPENSLLSIGRRFDQLEARMTSVLSGVATHADIEALRVAEVQIEEISAQLDQLRRQLARLDAIDAHLGTLATQLSDEKLTRLFSQSAGADDARLQAIDAQLGTIATQLSHDRLCGLITQSVSRSADFEGLATSAAHKTAMHFADQDLRDAQIRDIGEVRGMLESLINERRHSDENNASMLETMQQAIIRVLDRIDALELVQQPAGAGPASAKSQPYARPHAEHSQPSYSATQTQPESEDAAQQSASYDRDEPHMAPAPQAPFATAPFDLEAAFAREPEAGEQRPENTESSANAMSTLRHDLIADAHRAKLKAASKMDASSGSGQGRAGEHATAMGKKPGSEKARKRQSILRSPRVLMAILTLLAMIPAALFFMPRTPADNAASGVDSVLPLFEDGGSGASGADTEGVVPGSPRGEDIDSPPDDRPTKQSQKLGPGSLPSSDRNEDAGNPAREDTTGPVETAALPDGTQPPAKQLATQHGRERMAFLPDQASVRVDSTPAALMQERVLRLNNGASSKEGTPLELPPATVGPFSMRLAAAQGEPSAQFEVAARLAEGKGTDRDLKESAQWYQRSAASGFAMAQFRLGTLYERGVGVKADLARARVWYSRAAEQGNVKAMHNLAVLIAGRSGANPDYPTAVNWFTKAAERGLSDSQYNLAVLYESGLGVGKDVKEAYKWLLLAAQSGDKESMNRRDVLKSQLSAEDRAALEALAERWRARPTDPMANDSRAAGQAWRRHPQHITRG